MIFTFCALLSPPQWEEAKTQGVTEGVHASGAGWSVFWRVSSWCHLWPSISRIICLLYYWQYWARAETKNYRTDVALHGVFFILRITERPQSHQDTTFKEDTTRKRPPVKSSSTTAESWLEFSLLSLKKLSFKPNHNKQGSQLNDFKFTFSFKVQWFLGHELERQERQEN